MTKRKQHPSSTRRSEAKGKKSERRLRFVVSWRRVKKKSSERKASAGDEREQSENQKPRGKLQGSVNQVTGWWEVSLGSGTKTQRIRIGGDGSVEVSNLRGNFNRLSAVKRETEIILSHKRYRLARAEEPNERCSQNIKKRIGWKPPKWGENKSVTSEGWTERGNAYENFNESNRWRTTWHGNWKSKNWGKDRCTK